MSARAGIVVTGTEVLTAVITDRNGPWLSERLRELGLDVAQIVVVGDRPADIRAALDFLASEGVDVIVTTGGLGPTADDLTVQVVADFAERPLALDADLEREIAAILTRLSRRWRNLDMDAVMAANRKQALVPEGATVLAPVGTAPGVVVPPRDSTGPTVVVLPGPPRELQPMWETATGTEAFAAATAAAERRRSEVLRLFGLPESEIAATLRALADEGVDLEPLEITTCLRRSEIEIVTQFAPADEAAYAAVLAGFERRHGASIFSRDGSTIDEQIAGLLAGRTVATAESCTAGMLAARLTDRPGSSAYVLGGLVVYANAAKTALAGVPAELIERTGAVSPEVAEALARGARERLGAEIGVGITGVAGPDGGSEDKPVGHVCLCAQDDAGGEVALAVDLPGDRTTIRERATTVAMHMLRRLLAPAADASG